MLFTSFAVLPISCGKVYKRLKMSLFQMMMVILTMMTAVFSERNYCKECLDPIAGDVLRTSELILRGVAETAARSENSKFALIYLLLLWKPNLPLARPGVS